MRLRSAATPQFWQRFDALPASIQAIARRRYRLWQRDPFHPSLNFKKLRPGLWSVRITLNYRAIGRWVPGEPLIIWTWIGAHNEYDRRIK